MKMYYGAPQAVTTLVLTLALAGCGKSLPYMRIKYQQECTGAGTVRCKSMQIDINKMLLDANIDELHSEREAVAQCSGQETFDRAVQLLKERRDWLESGRPNFFLRWFQPEAQLQPDFSSFPKENELRNLAICKGPKDPVMGTLDAAASAAVTETPPPPVASSTPVSDSSASGPAVLSEPPIRMDLVAGTLEVLQDDPDSPFGRKLVFNGVPVEGADADFVHLVRKLQVRDREIVVVTTGCSGSACSFTHMLLLEFGPTGLLSRLENNSNDTKLSDPILGDGQEPKVLEQSSDSVLFTYDGHKGQHQVVYRYGEGFRAVR